MTQRVRYSAKTHMGRVRQANEDAVLALPDRGVWLVADGMGGHAAGEVASRILTDTVATLPDTGTAAGNMAALRTALYQAHEAVVEEAARRGGVTMGATVVALMLSDGHFVAFWAGDSRLYRLRDGVLEMLSHDHSMVADLVDRGELSWDEAESHPQSNAITRAVGVGDALELDKVRGRLSKGDRFVLCSDGLNKHVRSDRIGALAASEPIEIVADTLVSAALDGGGSDNVSVIVVDVL